MCHFLPAEAGMGHGQNAAGCQGRCRVPHKNRFLWRPRPDSRWQDIGGKEVASPYRKMSGSEGFKIIQIIFKFIFHIHEMFRVMYVFFSAFRKHDRTGAPVKNRGSETGLDFFNGSA